MTIDNKIKDEKLQYDINIEAVKLSALSSGKIDKYKYLTGDEILPSHPSRILVQANFTYSPLGKAFEKQIKTIEDQGIKQVKTLKALKSVENKEHIKSVGGIFPKEMRTNEIKNEIAENIKRKDLVYKKININMIFNNMKK